MKSKPLLFLYKHSDGGLLDANIPLRSDQRLVMCHECGVTLSVLKLRFVLRNKNIM